MPNRCQLPVVGVVALLLPATFVRSQDNPPRYFPLDVGNVWVYGGPVIYTELAVVRRRGDVAVLRERQTRARDGAVVWGPVYMWLVDRGSEIDIDLPEEGPMPWYRFEEDSFLRRDVVRGGTFCTDNTRVFVESRSEIVETPVGEFENCLLLSYPERHCEWGLLREWWCPGVGRVQYEYLHERGWCVWRLVEYGPRFVRGDITANGAVDIADPVALLGYLYQDGAEPECLDAADSDDSGALDLSDAVYLLQWAFSGGAAPPPPSPSQASGYGLEECGTDGATRDSLGCDSPPPACRAERKVNPYDCSFPEEG